MILDVAVLTTSPLQILSLSGLCLQKLRIWPGACAR